MLAHFDSTHKQGRDKRRYKNEMYAKSSQQMMDVSECFLKQTYHTKFIALNTLAR